MRIRSAVLKATKREGEGRVGRGRRIRGRRPISEKPLITRRSSPAAMGLRGRRGLPRHGLWQPWNVGNHGERCSQGRLSGAAAVCFQFQLCIARCAARSAADASVRDARRGPITSPVAVCCGFWTELMFADVFGKMQIFANSIAR